jgi:CRISPR/Cas system endoribonuclease Cas6 (RAMP superfamily)
MNTNLKNTRLICTLQFQKPVRADTYPPFVIRSVLGYHLKRMHCVAHQTPCQDCVFRRTCAYVFLFESIIEKDTPVLDGRDRASHPFRIIGHTEPGSILTELEISIQLFGRAVEYVPHVVFALREAGKEGLFRERVPYRLSVRNVQNEPILEKDRIIQFHIINNTEIYPAGSSIETKTVQLHCRSPLRFKVNNRLTSDFSAQDLVLASLRHIDTLFYLYGDGTEIANYKQTPDWEGEVKITNRTLAWRDYPRFSRRQGVPMKLGGHVGHLTISGSAPAWVWEALNLAGRIGTGKNTSFGFGHIEVTEE